MFFITKEKKQGTNMLSPIFHVLLIFENKKQFLKHKPKGPKIFLFIFCLEAEGEKKAPQLCITTIQFGCPFKIPRQ